MRDAGLPTRTPATLCASRLPDPGQFPVAGLPNEISPLHVAYAGRLIEEKGVQTLFEAVSELPAGSANLRILGEGTYRSELEDLARRLSLPVEFLGQGSESDVLDVLRWSHVVVVPTLVGRRFAEQWGRIAVEAMSAGRAVVASDSGELPLLLGDPEMVFPHGDARSLAVVLKRLADDREFLERKTKESSERAQEFSPANQVDNVVRLWSVILESAP